jgi:hypothetical protein
MLHVLRGKGARGVHASRAATAYDSTVPGYNSLDDLRRGVGIDGLGWFVTGALYVRGEERVCLRRKPHIYMSVCSTPRFSGSAVVILACLYGHLKAVQTDHARVLSQTA